MDREKRHEVEERLGEFAHVCGDEAGETVFYLLRLNRYRYCLSDKFRDALDEELQEQLSMFEENFEIVEKEETIPEQTRKYKELVRKNE